MANVSVSSMCVHVCLYMTFLATLLTSIKSFTEGENVQHQKWAEMHSPDCQGHFAFISILCRARLKWKGAVKRLTVKG